MEREFAGKRVLVTGGTKGIGAAVVRRLLDGGATVITTARSPSGSPDCIQADLSTSEGCDHVIKTTLDRHGGLDILVNSVGGSTAPGGGALALTDEHWRQALDLNLLSAVRLDRGFLPSMLRQGRGVIIHVSSILRTLPLFEATLAYAAAKAALSNYSKGLSKEMSPRGIRVNSVAPGYTETEAAVALVERLASQAGTDTDSARSRLMDSLGGFRWAALPGRKKSPNSSPSWRRTGPPPSPGASTSSMAARSRLSDRPDWMRPFTTHSQIAL